MAAKLLATNRTAGMTIGSPILFSSVAHGSALWILPARNQGKAGCGDRSGAAADGCGGASQRRGGIRFHREAAC